MQGMISKPGWLLLTCLLAAVVGIGCTPPGMARIPAGCFNMGDTFSEGDSDERPVHKVCLPSFNMDVHEVTNAEYAACVSAGRCIAPDDSSSDTRKPYYGEAKYDNFPVIYVSWNQATAYCSWAGKRLPTEAEWEYAARGGLSGKRYPWGDSISCSDANYERYRSSSHCWNFSGIANDTQEVGGYEESDYGLYDMSGNVWEWVNDWYDANYYTGRPNPDNDPPGPDNGGSYVLRGGHFGDPPGLLRVSSRISGNPLSQNLNMGFRCASDRALVNLSPGMQARMRNMNSLIWIGSILALFLTVFLLAFIISRISKKKLSVFIIPILGIWLVIIILAAIAIPHFRKVNQRYMQSEAKTNLAAITTAQDWYYGFVSQFAGGPGAFKLLNWEPVDENQYAYFCGDDFMPNKKGDPISRILTVLPDGVRPATDSVGFTCMAVGNIDNDSDLDVWTIDDFRQLKNVHSDLGR